MTRTPVQSAMRRTKGVMLARGAVMALLLGAVLLTIPTAHVDALKAAGAFKGEAIEKLKGNVVWLGGVLMGLVIAVVALMFVSGHSRAQDLVIRTAVGLMILASISGIVA
jgi:hypothetical protein